MTRAVGNGKVQQMNRDKLLLGVLKCTEAKKCDTYEDLLSGKKITV